MVDLPADAADFPGQITLQVNLDKAGFDIVSIIDDNTLQINPAVVATTKVTHNKSPGAGEAVCLFRFLSADYTSSKSEI